MSNTEKRGDVAIIIADGQILSIPNIWQSWLAADNESSSTTRLFVYSDQCPSSSSWWSQYRVASRRPKSKQSSGNEALERLRDTLYVLEVALETGCDRFIILTGS